MTTMSSTYRRDCLQTVAYRLARHPQVCFVWASRPVELLNTVAAGVVQSGSGNGGDETPFYDAGIRGNGQVVAVSDTGLDTDNCYFWDATASVPKNEQSNSFDRDVRKVIQYYAFADDEAVPSSHGTHVAGTIAGRRANGGRTESTGTADGIAFKAKLAFFDIGFRKLMLTIALLLVLLLVCSSPMKGSDLALSLPYFCCKPQQRRVVYRHLYRLPSLPLVSTLALGFTR